MRPAETVRAALIVLREIPAESIDEDTLLEFALEAGADDVKRVDDKFEVTCDPALFALVAAAPAEEKNAAAEN